MWLKTLLLSLLALGLGCIVGMPMGVLTTRSVSGRDTTRDRETGGSLPPSGRSAGGGTAFSAAADSLGLRVLEIHESEVEPGWFADYSTFDEKITALFAGVTTEALRALALEWSRRLDGEVPDEALSAVFMHWALRDAVSAWQTALTAPEKNRLHALGGCLRAMSATDALAAMQKVKSVLDEKLRAELEQKLDSDAPRFWKPEPLAKRLLAMPESERPKGLLDKVMESWMSRHLRGALEFAKTMPQKEREGVLAEVCQGLAWLDVDEAVRLANSIQDPKRHAEAWRGIIFSLDEMQPEKAVALLESLPLEQMEESLFTRIGSQNLPPDVVGRVAARLSGKSRDVFLSNVFDRAFMFTSQQLQARLDAIEFQPEDGPWVERVVNRLMQTTPDAANGWVDSLPDSRLRDHALAGMKDSLVSEEPELAVAFAAAIQDEEKRLHELRSSIDSWLRLDRAGAVNWLRTSGAQAMPDAERERWLSLSGTTR